MEEQWNEQDMRTWPTKEEVRVFLKTTNRTIERWQKDPTMLRKEMRMLTGHKSIPIYNPVDVARIKANKLEPIVSDNDTTLQRQGKPPQKKTKRRDNDMNFVVRMSPHVKIYLTKQEAIEYSGLPGKLILKKITEGIISAKKMGRWRIRRESLERYDAVNDTVLSLSYVVPQQLMTYATSERQP